MIVYFTSGSTVIRNQPQYNLHLHHSLSHAMKEKNAKEIDDRDVTENKELTLLELQHTLCDS